MLAERFDRKLEPVSWDDTAKLWIAAWREEVAQAKRILSDVRIDAITTGAREIHLAAARALGEDTASSADEDDLRHWWGNLVGAALAVMLVDADFAATAQIGEPFRFTRGDETVEPFVELAQLLDGELSAGAWRARWAALGFADRKLIA